MKKTVLILIGLMGIITACTNSKRAEQEREDSLRAADSIARVEALEAARLDSIRQDSIRQDSIKRAEDLEKNFPTVKMLTAGDMGNFGLAIKKASQLGNTFTSHGYKKEGNNSYIFDEGGSHQVMIKIMPKKIENYRYDEDYPEDNDPYITMTDVVLTFSNDEDAIKFVNTAPRKLDQIKRNKNVVTVEDRDGD